MGRTDEVTGRRGPGTELDDLDATVQAAVTRTGSTLQIALSALLVILGLWIALTDPSIPMGLFDLISPRVWGLITTTFFSLTAIHGWAGLIRRDPVLIIDEHGVDDRRTWFSAGRVSWDEITDFEAVRFRMVAVRLTDPDAILARVSPWKRWLLRLDSKIFGTPMHLALGGLEGGRDALTESLRGRLDQAIAEEMKSDKGWDPRPLTLPQRSD